MTMPYDASTGPGDPGPTEAYLRWRHLQEQADAERDALPARSVLPRLVFWVVGLFTAPFILGGGAMVLFGDELSTTIFGLVMLTLFLPGLIALYRWAHPRT